MFLNQPASSDTRPNFAFALYDLKTHRQIQKYKNENTRLLTQTQAKLKKVDVSDSTRIIYTQSNFAFEQLLSVECPDTNTNKTEGQMQIKHNCKNCSYHTQHVRQYVVKRTLDRLKNFMN